MSTDLRDQRVFVVAPGPVVLFFPQVLKLLADLRRMESGQRSTAKFYSVEGEILMVVGTRQSGFHLGMTGAFDLDGLRAALASVADDATAETEPSVVAAQLAPRRWPPSWLARSRH